MFISQEYFDEICLENVELFFDDENDIDDEKDADRALKEKEQQQQQQQQAVEETLEQYKTRGAVPELGQREWPALLRMLERQGAEYAI